MIGLRVPRVTVIIPTYNWSTVLPFSIGSVLAQTFSDFELLVVGDGCTDDSEDVVRAVDDRRVHWINIARTGHQSGPNNEGIRRARGDRVAFLGHDDLWMPDHLALHVARDADFTCSVAALISAASRSIELTRPDPGLSRWVPPSSFAYRRDLGIAWPDHRELRDPPERELTRRIVESGASTAIVPRITVLKFPSSERRNVYRDRPFHEQRAWLARVRAEPDLESVLRAQAVDGRLRRASLLLRQPSQWRAFVWRRGGARIRARQRFKGVS
jgi:glycosyltransferase involved in cell wall biosynthesis